jgi:hypothetical protein
MMMATIDDCVECERFAERWARNGMHIECPAYMPRDKYDRTCVYIEALRNDRKKLEAGNINTTFPPDRLGGIR